MQTIGNARTSTDLVHTNWRARKRREALAELEPVVYYLLHFGAIKIGTTTRLQSRLAQLGSDWSDVLVIERGGKDLEAQMHERFAHLRINGPGMGVEHFRYCPELVDYINGKRSEMQLPPI